MHQFTTRLLAGTIAAILVAFGTSGCRRSSPAPRLEHAAHPTAGAALRPVNDTEQLRPLLEAAFDARDSNLYRALADTRIWLKHQRTNGGGDLHPAEPFTLERLAATLAAFEELLRESADPRMFSDAILKRFDAFESVGAPPDARVQFTAYYAPEFSASRTRSARFQFPLCAPPPELAPDNPERITWRTRAQIERDPELMRRLAIAWLENPLDVYLIHVNGSARLRLVDDDNGEEKHETSQSAGVMNVTYVCTNEREYTSLGRLLIEAGLSSPEEMSMTKIRELHERDPALVEALMLRNNRFVFFAESRDAGWPRGSMGIPLAPGASVATDKTCFPAGGVALIDTRLPAPDREDVAERISSPQGASDGGAKDNNEAEPRPITRFVLDHDTGGAIKGPGRADLFLGVGDAAGRIAGHVNHRGRLFYLIIDDEP